jgi:hypothetical protein
MPKVVIKNSLGFKKRPGFAIFLVAGIIFVVLLILLITVGASAFVGNRQGASAGDGVITANSGNQTACSDSTVKYDSSYQPWITDAANKYLGGDQAALIALVKVESGWSPTAAAPSSSAAGLGQFLASSGAGWPEFVGGSDGKGITWPTGTIYPGTPASNSNDARFDPKRSIYASAHYLGQLITKDGGLEAAYEQGYHGYCKNMSSASCQSQKAAALSAGAKLMTIYNNLKNGGGCTSSAPATPVVAGSSDGSCLPVAYIHQADALYNDSGWCGRSSQAQVVNFFNPNQTPSPTDPSFQNQNKLSLSTVIKKSGNKPYVAVHTKDINAAIASIQHGYPVIVETDLEGGQHIFVLTGYNSATQTFKANDTNTGHGSFQTTCTSRIGGANGVTLTVANLIPHLVAQGQYFILVNKF